MQPSFAELGGCMRWIVLIPKCIAAQFFSLEESMERQWVGQAATTNQVEADIQYVMAAAGNDAANY